jgi:uncharacterized protein YjbI with pentapeptide repeats
MNVFKLFLKSLLILMFIAVSIVVMALISIVRNPITQTADKRDIDFFARYEQKRPEVEITRMKQDMDRLSKTGLCVGCDFNARRTEKESTDLYQAIKLAKEKGLTIDLSDADLFFAQLENVDLSGAHLNQANLMGAHLNGANLSGAQLKGAILVGTNLQQANLKNADLTGALLDRAQLSKADLTGAILHKATLFLTHVSGANMSNVNLTNAVIVRGLAGDATLIGADFRGAWIDNTFSKNADLTDAQFDNWFMRSFNRLTLWLALLWKSATNKY